MPLVGSYSVGVEVAAEAVQLLVVRPVAEAHAVLERQVRAQLPAVLREGVDVPVAELAERLPGRRVAGACRALVELPDAADQHVGAGVAGAVVVVGAEPQLAGLEVLEVLLLLAALDRDAELQAVRAEQLGELVAELQRVVVRIHVVRLRPQVADLAAAAPAVEHVGRQVRAVGSPGRCPGS